MLCTKLIIRDKKTLSISPLEVINILCYNHQCICLKALVVQRIEVELSISNKEVLAVSIWYGMLKKYACPFGRTNKETESIEKKRV